MGPTQHDPTPPAQPPLGPTPARRHGLRLAIGLAAILTLASTWTPPLLCYYTRGDLHVAYDTTRLDPSLYADNAVLPPSDWTIRTWQWSSGPGLRRDLFSECLWMGSTIGSTESTNPNRTRIVVSSGWPLRIAEYTEFDPQMPRNLAGEPRAWSRYGVPISYQRRLPMRCHPLAVAINLAFWTAAAWGACAAFTLVRTTRRRRRGMCGACAYPLNGVPVCPECGEPAPLTRGSAS